VGRGETDDGAAILEFDARYCRGCRQGSHEAPQAGFGDPEQFTPDGRTLPGLRIDLVDVSGAESFELPVQGLPA
jgi:hypothetical protein